MPAEHLARRIARAVACLDLRPLFDSYAGTGSAPYRPDLLLAVVLYEYQLGRHRPAQWARDVRENEPLRWLAFGAALSRARWYTFRARLAPLLEAWHQQVLRLAQQEGITSATRAALDGSLVAAAASRHKSVNENGLSQRRQLLDAAVAADNAESPGALAAAAAPTTADLLAPAVAAAPSPNSLEPSPTARPGWMAPTRRGRRRQQQRYERARIQMEQRHGHNQKQRTGRRRPRERVILSLGDAEAPWGLDKFKVYRPLYNVQVFNDLDSPLVLGYGVFAQVGDAATLGPMLDRFRAGVGHLPRQLLTDSGYATGPNLAVLEARGVVLYAPWQENDNRSRPRGNKPSPQLPKSAFTWRQELQTYQCPEGYLLDPAGRRTYQQGGLQRVTLQYRCAPSHCQGCPRQKDCTKKPASGRMVGRNEYEAEIERLRARMQTEESRALYRLRKQTVERQFAELKEHRQLRGFSGQGKDRADTEVGLLLLVHNLLIRDRILSKPLPLATAKQANGSG